MAKNFSFHCAALALLLSMLAAAQAHAGLRTYDNLTISKLLISNDNYGGCMAKIDTSITYCADDWISFGCTGEFNDATLAWRMYDQAQMAFSLGKTIRLDVENHEKYNGFCTAKRIDVYLDEPLP